MLDAGVPDGYHAFRPRRDEWNVTPKGDRDVRPIEAAEVERAVRNAEPSAWVVAHRLLRRVIKRDRGLTGFGTHVPHRHAYAISGQSLAAIVDGTELGRRPGDDWPATVILLPRPEPAELARTPGDVVLNDYWRRLFHARVHAALERKFAEGHLTERDLHARLDAIGLTEFDEIRNVLRSEGMLMPPADEKTLFIEFAAMYLELRRFAPALLPHTFPGLGDTAGIDELLASDVDDEALFLATRVEGARDPESPAEPPPEHKAVEPAESLPHDESDLPEKGTARRLIRRAWGAGARGNIVRAAILRTQAARVVPPPLVQPLRNGARGELDHLVLRLQRALGFDDEIAERWKQALAMLLERASRGFWTPEARLLYDLQKVCVDHEREVYTVDLVEWVASWGRRPLRRVQPLLRVVMAAHHLRSASRRLRAVHLSSQERAGLDALLHPALEGAQAMLRDRLRGPIDHTLAGTGLHPKNLPERVAYQKLVEELLDRIAGRGFLSLGDLRDAYSRSNMKLPDLSGAVEFLRGDRLLQADRALAHSLDGVYRRGEIYLRWLQRLSALAFATPWGRFLTLYVALPYGGAFILLEGLQHLVELIVHWTGGSHVQLRNVGSLLLLGTVALGVVNFLSFRHRFLIAMRTGGHLLRLVLVDSFAWLLKHPFFRRIYGHRLTSLAWKFAFKPALISVPFWALAGVLGFDQRETIQFGGAAFLGANLLLNSHIGRDIEEIVADEAVRAWRQLAHNIVPGTFRFVMATFDAILETVDRLLYAVDEWLRFRTGQTRASIAIKAVLGAVWFFIAYLIRIYVNLLIEPQVNPIKHFPVVTVSHKIILPLSLTLTRLLAAPFLPLLGPVVANFIAATNVLLLPGVFGFLVWELKENWRLYEANRRESLGSVIVGSHGETLGRLLRPGFHSGTLPKLFAKLRKSERRLLRDGEEKAVLKHREALHHVEEAIERFLAREFLSLVRQSRTLGALGIDGGVRDVSTNRIGVEFHIKGHVDGLRIVFEERTGRLIASVAETGWVTQLSDKQRRALLTAIVGLYKLSGVEWLREPARLGLAPSPLADADSRRTKAPLVPFQQVEIPWKRWVEAWERDQAGAGHPPRFVVGLPVLPTTDLARRKRQRPSRR